MDAAEPERHYARLRFLPGEGMGIKVWCGAGGDVAILQQQRIGVFGERADGDATLEGGPMLIVCSKHGNHLGVVETWEAAPERGGAIKMHQSLRLFPLPDGEVVRLDEQNADFADEVQKALQQANKPADT